MTTPTTTSDFGSQGGKELLESFMHFPSPLALLNLDGQIELVNNRFSDCLRRAEIDPQALAVIAQAPGTGWHMLRSSSDSERPGRRARAVRTPNRILAIVAETGETQTSGTHDALLSRVSELEALVATDHLTGAWNRGHLDRVLPAEITRSASYRQPLSLILIDIDHFKRINDTFGHPVGDSVLCELVKLVKSRIRPSDLLFRWGGEEFVLLIASAGYRQAETIAENLRRSIAEHNFNEVGAVTISLGVAEYEGSEAAEHWFNRLDKALYAAKHAGRNRSVVDRKGNSDTWAAAPGASALRLVWQEGYECGNATIDDEHRELFRLANELIDASLAEPFERASFNAALLTLINHVRKHFADEEAILSSYCYAQLDEHRRSHAGLLQRARRFQELAESGEFDMGDMIEFLAQDVVARHLRIVDRGFFPLFAKERN